tara:strand:- start:1997 stop:3637 length:1641 start_codon:yes stop_codon:yes gene_type:complete
MRYWPSFYNTEWVGGGMSGAGRSTTARIALMITFLFLGTILLTVTTAQSDDPKVLTHERNRLYFYGESNGDGYATWPMWNHAQASDPNSDDSIGEQNAFVPGDPNNGGGTREFTFDGQVASDNITEINSELTITGNFRLSIFCQGSCNTDVTVFLRKGGVDITSVTVSPENEGGDTYIFEFFHNIKEIKADETLGLRIQFTKPSGAGDGYTLYLGQNDFQMDIPVIPPETSDIGDVLLEEGSAWKTPYADAGLGFQASSTEKVGIVMPIFLGILLLAGAICGVVFTPGMPAMTGAAVLTCLSLIGPMVAAPIVSYMDVAEHSDVDMEPNMYTVDQFASLEASSGSFLTEFSQGDEFEIWVPLNGNEVYSKSIQHNGRSAILWGLAHEEHNELLGNSEITTIAGREAIQLYFSSIIQYTDDLDCTETSNENDTDEDGQTSACAEYDLTKSGGIVLKVVLGQDGESVRPINNVNVTLTDGTPRNAVLWTDTEPMGTPQTWGSYSLAGLIPAIGCLGFGVWTIVNSKRNSQYEDDEYDFDDDFIDELDI